MRYWLHRLKPQIASGVHVTIYTQPPTDLQEVALVEELRLAGCRVECGNVCTKRS